MYRRSRPSVMALVDVTDTTTEYSLSSATIIEDGAAVEEQDIRLRAGCIAFDLFARADADIKYSWLAGEVNKASDGVYSTIPAGEHGGETGIWTPREFDAHHNAILKNIYLTATAVTEVEIRIFYEW